MINLLPSETKKSFRAARMNVILRRYIIFTCSIALSVAAVFGVGYYLTITDNERAKQELATLNAQTVLYAEEKKAAEEFAQNLTIAKSILSSEITFSTLAVDIAKTMPQDTVLTRLSLDTASIGKPITLNTRTKDPEGGLRIKSALEDSPLFSNVSIQTLTNPSPENAESTDPIAVAYPYSVVLGAVFDNSETKETP